MFKLLIIQAGTFANVGGKWKAGKATHQQTC
jgi:hypothetical protein